MRLSASTLLAAAPALVLAAALDAPQPEARPAPEVASSVASVAPTARPALHLPASPDGRRAAVIPSQAVIEKLGKGDRLLLEGDHRGALFAYQDAVYLQPGYVPARVRLGRAYLALRYPAQAIAQAQAALASDPEDVDARDLLADATAAVAARAVPPEPVAPAGSARVYRLLPESAPPTRDAARADPPPGPPPAR